MKIDAICTDCPDGKITVEYRFTPFNGSPIQVAQEWPAILKPLKQFARSGQDRGAGDIIARVIGPIGGYAFKVWYKNLFGQDCGCGHRQEVLNQRWPL